MKVQILVWWIADAPTCAPSAASCAEIWRIWECRGDQESNHLKITHKYRPTTAWFKVLSHFSLSSYVCSLFSQYSVKPTSWSLTQVLKVQATLTFYDAIKAISPFTRTAVDRVLGLCSSWNLSQPTAVRASDHLSRFCTGHGKMRERVWSTRMNILHPSKNVNLNPLITHKFYIIDRKTLNLMTFLLKTASVIMFITEFFFKGKQMKVASRRRQQGALETIIMVNMRGEKHREGKKQTWSYQWWGTILPPPWGNWQNSSRDKGVTVEENTWSHIGNYKVWRELKDGDPVWDLISFKLKSTLEYNT